MPGKGRDAARAAGDMSSVGAYDGFESRDGTPGDTGNGETGGGEGNRAEGAV